MEEENQQQVIVVLTHTILHPCIDVVTVKEVHGMLISVFNRNQTKQALQRHPICLTNYDNNYILEEIEHRKTIYYEQKIRDHGDDK